MTATYPTHCENPACGAQLPPARGRGNVRHYCPSVPGQSSCRQEAYILRQPRVVAYMDRLKEER